MRWELVLAIGMVVSQGVVAIALVRVVRSFGQYTEVVMAAHKSNMLIHQSNLEVSRSLRALGEQLPSDHTAIFVHEEPEEKTA